MNKTLIIIISSLFIFAYSASAQGIKFSMGIQGGVAGNTFEESNILAKPFCFDGFGGVHAALRLGKVFALQAECNYAMIHNVLLAEGSDLNAKQTYIQIPLVLQIWAGRSVIFEGGYQPSILQKATIGNGREDKNATVKFGSLLAGITFNLGKTVYLSLRYTHAAGVYNGYTRDTFSGALGIRFFTTKKSALK